MKKRKKGVDPEVLRLREAREKEERQKQENDNFYNAQSTFSMFSGLRKKTDATTSGEPRMTKIVPPADTIVNISTAVEPKKKEMVVMGTGDIRDSDFYGGYAKKVILRDLLQVL